MKIKDIVLSWDLILSIFIAIIFFALTPSFMNNQFAITLYEIGISVLSIIFSVFFAALAIIISSSDDDFVRFLEEEGDYSVIIDTFRYSLAVLFLALIYSIIFAVVTSYWINEGQVNQQFYFVLLFIFLFSYALLVTFNSTNDAIKYSKYRTKYLNKKKQRHDG